MTEDLYYSNGSLGTLKIPAINLTVKVYQGTDSAALKKGADHWSREDFSQEANPEVFTGVYSRELYNAIRQTMV